MLYHVSSHGIVLPAYYVVLAMYAAFPRWREGGRLQPIWKFATFSLNLFPDWQAGNAYAHAWSLCVEEHFYLLLPVWLLAGRARTATIVVGDMLGRRWWRQSWQPGMRARRSWPLSRPSTIRVGRAWIGC
jgi:peptidoglycan/LPS O-acetylase OafA/YrhL